MNYESNFSFLELLASFSPDVKKWSAKNELEGNVLRGVGTLAEGVAIPAHLPESNACHPAAFKIHLNASSDDVGGEAMLMQRNDEYTSCDEDAAFRSCCQQKVPMDVKEPRYKKRKRREMASGIAGSSGKVLDKGSQGMTLLDHSNVSLKCNQEENKTATESEKIPVGGSLLMTFSPGCTIPPIETLVTTFSRFGLLKVSGIEIIDESTVRVPYEGSSEARFAFEQLEKSKPFGESIATCELELPAVVLWPVKRRNRSKMPMLDGHRIQPKPPDVAFMKQNMEMMKSTLEKAGAELSQEVRDKLENEINGFLNKIGVTCQKETTGSKCNIKGAAKLRVYTRRNMISGPIKGSPS